ncbi:MAG: hypothetical protein ICV65_12670 [Flavisolibacter sp.]|nr:hypothetical protein [Flavisolibacter sp.]
MLPVAISIGIIAFILIAFSVVVLTITLCFFILNRNTSGEWVSCSYWTTEEKPPTLLQSFKELFQFKKTARATKLFKQLSKMYSYSYVEKQKAPGSKEERTGGIFQLQQERIAPPQEQWNAPLQKTERADQKEERQIVQAQRELQKKIEQLELLLEQKEHEVQNVKQYEAIVQKMNARLENVY